MTDGTSAVVKTGRGSYGDMLVVPGTMLGEKYEIDEIIGEGGMGIIARAVNVDLQTTVAVKILQPKLLHDEVALARFLQEARGVSKLRSPHIVRMLDVNSHPPDPPFMVMELLSGEDLDSMVQRRGKLPPDVVVELVLQSCAGVGVAHAAGILHRDLKPANLFLTRNDDGTCVLKVLDFGLMKAAPKGGAKLTHPNDVFGSPSFMSPEQIAGEVVDERTDIWALGAILFELITGRPAFGAESIPQTLVNVATLEPPLVSTLVPSVAPELEAIVSRCLAKDRTARFRTVTELTAALTPLRVPVDLPPLLSGAVIHTSVAPPPSRTAATEAELPAPAPPKLTPPEGRTDTTDKIALPRKRSRTPGIVALAMFGAIVGVIVGLVVYGSRADEPTATSKNVSTSASVTASATAPVPTTTETTLGTNVADLPPAPVTAPKSTVGPRPTHAPSVDTAPSAAATPVVTVAPVAAPRPPTAAPSIDPYPEFGRRK